jgi:hypothetical protein
MSYEEFDSFHYLTDISQLVHATALLDTYLSDTARFLLLLHPGALGMRQALDIHDVLAARPNPRYNLRSQTKWVRSRMDRF